MSKTHVAKNAKKQQWEILYVDEIIWAKLWRTAANVQRINNNENNRIISSAVWNQLHMKYYYEIWWAYKNSARVGVVIQCDNLVCEEFNERNTALIC